MGRGLESDDVDARRAKEGMSAVHGTPGHFDGPDRITRHAKRSPMIGTWAASARPDEMREPDSVSHRPHGRAALRERLRLSRSRTQSKRRQAAPQARLA